MPEINGKQVILKETLAASEWWPLMPVLQNLGDQDGQTLMDTLDWETVCAMVSGAVKSWEFAGGPSNADDVGKLDAFAELIPLLGVIARYVGTRASSLGELASESI